MAIYTDSFDQGAQGGFRNMLLNGDLNIWQRGVGPVTTASFSDQWTGLYFGSCDRWGIASSNAADQEFLKRVLITASIPFTYGATIPGNGQSVMQVVEEGAHRLVTGRTYTFSVWADTPPTLSISDTDGSLLQYSQGPLKVIETADGTWKRYAQTITITIPNGDHLGVFIRNDQSVEMTWTGAQLEEGDTATAFEQTDYMQMLRMCRRYYMRIDEFNQTTQENSGTGTALMVNYVFPVEMYDVPTIVSAHTGYTVNWAFGSYDATKNSLSIIGSSIGGTGYRDVRYDYYQVAAEVK